MGEILAFEESRRGFRRRHATEGANEAQILFFTGVRYERHEETPAAPVKRAAALRRKKSSKPTGKKRA